MPVKVRNGKDRFEINEDNYLDSLVKLDELIQPGTLVMINNYCTSTLPMTPRRSDNTHLFFSGGNISEEGVFDIEGGKRNYTYASVSRKNPEWFSIHHGRDSLDHSSIAIPSLRFIEHYNEGTFSPGPGTYFTSRHGSGTDEIVVGDSLKKKFPDAYQALKFTRDALFFEIPQFYASPGYLMQTKDLDNDQERERDREATKLIVANAAMKLMHQVDHEDLHAVQIGYYHDGAKGFRRHGHPVDNEDYVINQLSHPCKALAVVKTNGTEGYILPLNDIGEALVTEAFSEKRFREAFPIGADHVISTRDWRRKGVRQKLVDTLVGVANKKAIESQ